MSRDFEVLTTKRLRSAEKVVKQAASCHILSSVDFITSTFESEFLVHTARALRAEVKVSETAIQAPLLHAPTRTADRAGAFRWRGRKRWQSPPPLAPAKPPQHRANARSDG